MKLSGENQAASFSEFIMNTAIILQGSNAGDRLKMLQESREMIMDKIGILVNESSLYESEPWGFDSEVWFLNKVLHIETQLYAHQLLDALLEIEQKLGRVRHPSSNSYESRTIDLDILFFNDDVIHSQDLDVPHPKIHLRRFVLLPLFEILPDWYHVEKALTVSQLLDCCLDKTQVNIFESLSEL